MAGHALVALHAAPAIIEEQLGRIGDGDASGIGAIGAFAQLTFDLDEEVVGFGAAVELGALALALRVGEVDRPGGSFLQIRLRIRAIVSMKVCAPALARARTPGCREMPTIPRRCSCRFLWRAGLRSKPAGRPF
jgi:hypothetical protein